MLCALHGPHCRDISRPTSLPHPTSLTDPSAKLHARPCTGGRMSLLTCFQRRAFYRSALLIGVLFTLQPAVSSAFASDEVLDWMRITNDTALSSSITVANPLLTARLLALVSASMFDAVNGIDPRYRPYHVRPDAPRHASQRAAAIEAAYEILVLFYPTLQSSLTAQRDASIAALTDSPSA